MCTSGISEKYMWKIEDFSSLGSETHHSQGFYAFGIAWILCIKPKGMHAISESNQGPVILNGTQFLVGLSSLKAGRPLYVEYRLAVVNQKFRDQTIKYDLEREILPGYSTLCKAMCLTELLDPEKGFIINDTCYITVEIIRVMNILKSSRVTKPKPEPEQEPEPEPEPGRGHWGNFFQALIGAIVPSSNEVADNKETTDSRDKDDIPVSVEATAQAAGDSKSASDKNSGENQNIEAEDEERSLSLSRWFQKRKEKIGNYFNDDSGYQRL